MNFEVDPSNIVTGRRTRRGTKRLVDSKDWQQSYMSLVLEDVPEGEIEAALHESVDDGDTILSSDNNETDKTLSEENSFLASESADSQHTDDEFSVLSSEDEDEDDDEIEESASEKSDVKPRAPKGKRTLVKSNFCVDNDDLEEEFQ